MTSPLLLLSRDGSRPGLPPSGSGATTVSAEDEEESARLIWSACNSDILEVSDDQELGAAAISRETHVYAGWFLLCIARTSPEI